MSIFRQIRKGVPLYTHAKYQGGRQLGGGGGAIVGK